MLNRDKIEADLECRT